MFRFTHRRLFRHIFCRTGFRAFRAGFYRRFRRHHLHRRRGRRRGQRLDWPDRSLCLRLSSAAIILGLILILRPGLILGFGLVLSLILPLVLPLILPLVLSSLRPVLTSLIRTFGILRIVDNYNFFLLWGLAFLWFPLFCRILHWFGRLHCFFFH